MTLWVKNGHIPKKFFLPFSRKMLIFFEKIVRLKNIQNLISHKKGYIDFRRQTRPFLQKGLVPHKISFSLSFSENTTFFEKKTLLDKW